MKKLLALLLALVMVLSMVACGTSSGGGDTEEDEEDGFSSSVKVAKAYVKAYASRDASDLLDTLPEFMWDVYADQCDLEEGYTRKELVKAMEEEVDEDDIINIKIKSAEKSEDYDDDEVEEILEQLADVYKFDTDDIQKAEIIALECEYKDGDETEEDSAEVLCVKIDGSWYAITNK